MTSKTNNLPESWLKVRFDEIIVNLDGKRIPVSRIDRNQRAGDFPYYGASGIIDTIDRYLFDGEYLLIAEDGANLLSRSTPIAFLAKGKFWVNNHAHVIQSVADLVPLPYLQHYFQSIDLTPYVSGSAQPKLNQKNLSRVFVPLPPLNEQHRIVKKIETLTTHSRKAREALDAIPPLLDQFRQSVLAAAFRGDLTADWRAENPEVESGEELLERISEERRLAWEISELEKMMQKGKSPKNDRWKKKYKEVVFEEAQLTIELPLNWASTVIGKVSTCLDKLRKPINKTERAGRVGNVPYYGANGQVGWIDDHLFDEELVIVVEDETFVGRTKPFCYKISGKSWINNHAHVLRADGGISADYLNYSLMFYPFIPLTSGTTGRRKLTQGALLSAPYSLPPVEEQEEIVARINRYFALADSLQSAYESGSSQLPQLDQSILAKAFRGELIPQDPTDEPATHLLNRIRTERAKTQKTKKKAQRKKKS